MFVLADPMTVLAACTTGGFVAGVGLSAFVFRSRRNEDLAAAYRDGWHDHQTSDWDTPGNPDLLDEPDDDEEEATAWFGALRDDHDGQDDDPDTATLMTARQVDELRSEMGDMQAWGRMMSRWKTERLAEVSLSLDGMAERMLSAPLPWEHEEEQWDE